MTAEKHPGRIVLGVVKPKKKIAHMTPEERHEFAAALGDAMAASPRKKGGAPGKTSSA